MQPRLADRQRRQVRAIQDSTPAPYGGLNGRDPVSAMEAVYAVQLDNWYQYEDALRLRNGSVIHADTGLTGFTTESLFDFDANGIKRLMACINGKIYDVTTTYPFVVKSGFTNNDWVSVPFAERVFLVNNANADLPHTFDGNSVELSGWSGADLAPGRLNFVFVYKSRVYYIEKDTLNLWYGGLSAVTGSLTKFNLLGAGVGGGVRGGTLVAGATISIDGGSGADDLMVLFTTKGEAIVYQGLDPEDDSWGLVGVYQVGEPLSRKAFIGAGSDLIYATREGLASLTDVFPFGRTGFEPRLSDILGNKVREFIKRQETLPGWQVAVYPRANMILFNVPYDNNVWHQYVMNTRTKAWSRFTGWNGQCWRVFDNRLFFGAADGKVYEADRGVTDNGSSIVAIGQPAWNYFGAPNVEKAMSNVTPTLVGHVTPSVEMSVAHDFGAFPDYTSVGIRAVENLPIWDEAIWDQATWTGESAWFAPDWCASVSGRAIGVRMKVTSTADPVEWHKTSYLFEPSKWR